MRKFTFLALAASLLFVLSSFMTKNETNTSETENCNCAEVSKADYNSTHAEDLTSADLLTENPRGTVTFYASPKGTRTKYKYKWELIRPIMATSPNMYQLELTAVIDGKAEKVFTSFLHYIPKSGETMVKVCHAVKKQSNGEWVPDRGCREHLKVTINGSGSIADEIRGTKMQTAAMNRYKLSDAEIKSSTKPRTDIYGSSGLPLAADAAARVLIFKYAGVFQR